MTTFDEGIKRAERYLIDRDKYCYFFGAKGDYMSDTKMEYLWRMYYDTYFYKYKDRKKELFDFCRGKIGFDCSGFITKIFDLPIQNSTSLYENCPIKTSVVDGVHGSLLWKPGHVGIDVGYGRFIHIGSAFGSFEQGLNRDNPGFWQKSGQLKNVDYSRANNFAGKLNI